MLLFIKVLHSFGNYILHSSHLHKVVFWGNIKVKLIEMRFYDGKIRKIY